MWLRQNHAMPRNWTKLRNLGSHGIKADEMFGAIGEVVKKGGVLKTEGSSGEECCELIPALPKDMLPNNLKLRYFYTLWPFLPPTLSGARPIRVGGLPPRRSKSARKLPDPELATESQVVMTSENAMRLSTWWKVANLTCFPKSSKKRSQTLKACFDFSRRIGDSAVRSTRTEKDSGLDETVGEQRILGGGIAFLIPAKGFAELHVATAEPSAGSWRRRRSVSSGMAGDSCMKGNGG